MCHIMHIFLKLFTIFMVLDFSQIYSSSKKAHHANMNESPTIHSKTRKKKKPHIAAIITH